MAVTAGENEIRAAESALYRAMIAKDIAALDEILTDDIFYIHSPGFAEDKGAYLAGVKKGLYDYEAVTSRNVTIKLMGDAAVMHGIADMRVGETGKPMKLLHLLFTLAWVHTDGAWRLSVRQATRIPGE
jgi:ketosteroid isomerase-like protein